MRIRRCLTQQEQDAALNCPVTARQEELAQLAWALAHPARLRILSILRERSACLCGDLVERMPLSQSTVSEHLKVLKEAGLVRAEADSGRTCYKLSEERLGQLKDFISEL